MNRMILPPGALRLVLAGMVLASHYWPGRWAPFEAAAVHGFFFLSGYWVARLWDLKYAKCERRILTFYVSRMWRVYPLATISTLLMALIAAPAPDRLWSSLILVGEHQIGSPINPPTWSLAIELQFYLLAPLIFVLMRNSVFAIFALAISFVFWMIFAFGEQNLFVIHFLVMFLLGVLYWQAPSWRVPERHALYGLYFLVFMIIVPNIPPIRSLLPDLSYVIRIASVAITIPALPYIAASLNKTSTSFDRILGDLAFPVFLFHYPALLLAKSWAPASASIWAILLTSAFSLVAYLAVDRNLEHWRRAFVDAQMRRRVLAEA